MVLDDGERSAAERVRRARSQANRSATVPGLALHDRDGEGPADRRRNRHSARSTRCRCRRAITWHRWRQRCLPGAPPDVARRDRAGMSVPLLASARSGSSARVRARAVDRLGVAATSRRSATTCSSPTICSGITQSRSLELAHALRGSGIRKRWMLVQSRVDLVARHPELLEAWRPLARKDFDIFFGLEAATNDGLDRSMKDATVDQTVARRRRSRGDSATASPATSSSIRPGARPISSSLWAFVERHQLFQAGLHDPDAAAGHGVLR